MDIVIVIIEIIVAIVWIQQGVVRYDFWKDGKPGGGFIPVIFASIVLAGAVVILIREVFGKKNTKKKYAFELSAFMPAAAAVLGGFMLQVLGIVLTVFLFTSIWMRFLSKYSWIKTLISSTLFTFFIYGVFRLWLRVPFPQGFIFQIF